MCCGRTPQGVRGLKLSLCVEAGVKSQSHSARSAWIETGSFSRALSRMEVALRKECVD